MNSILLPIVFLEFWFFEAPKELILYFHSVNKAFMRLFSVGLLLTTLFKPIKNEYRQGLIAFSIGMGIVIKTAILITAAILFIPLLCIEIILFLFFLSFPILTVLLLLSQITSL